MEEAVKEVAHVVASACELACLLVLAVAAVAAVAKSVWRWRSYHTLPMKKEIWLQFAAAIVLALEFALAADIADTIIAPTWEDLGHLAAIAAIRTILNYFLAKDLESFVEPSLANEGKEP